MEPRAGRATLTAMAANRRREYGFAIILICVVLLAAILASLMPGIRGGADDQRCRFRLRRLGEAVHRWVEDHGRRAYPQLVNPPAAQPWRPGRAGAIDTVLWEYLQGDLPRPQRQEESREAHLARLRDASLAVCPITGFAYWYNERLATTDPTAVAAGEVGAITYFHCQRTVDGAWPHRHDGADGVHAVRGHGQQFQIDAEQVAAFADAVRARRAAHPDDPDLPTLEAKLARYRAGLERARAEDRLPVVTEVSLGVRVDFQPR